MSDAPAINTQACEKCGTVTTDGSVTIRGFFRKHNRWLCSQCRTNRRPQHPWILPFSLLFIFLIILGAQISRSNPATDADPSRYAWAWAVVAWSVGGEMMVFLHESAHAIAAVATGMKVKGISIGRGPRVCRLHLLKMFIDLHTVPGGGVCWTHSCPPNGWRWRNAVMIAAGPTVHALAIAILTSIWVTQDWNRLDHFTNASASVAALVYLNLAALSLNLLPRNARWNGVPLRTDGGRLLDLLKRKAPASAFEQALHKVTTLADERKWSQAQGAARQALLQPFATAPQYASVFSCWIAVANVRLGGEDYLQEADQRSAQCLALAPTDATTQTVRACVLLALHRDDQAEKLLTLAQAGPLNPSAEKAAAHLWTELHRRRNNLPEMHRWQQIAQKLDPTAAYNMFPNPQPAPIKSPTV